MPGDKIRPVLVLTRERFITRLHSVVVAPVTTRVRVIPTEVPLIEEDGLACSCAVNFDNVFTLRRERLRERICVLNAGSLDQVCQVYRFAVGC